MNAGTLLAGKYRLVSLLGRGGMGEVWRADRLGWQAPVAIKLLHGPATRDAQALDRFQREARLVAGLRSIHVVQVLDDGVDDTTGAPFMVMELLEGETLAERLLRVQRLRPEVVAQVISQIGRALGRAHDAGLIHRDLKPDNILIVRNDDEEILKVLDFGIAKWLAAPQWSPSRTLAGQMLGTPVYMSPEHFGSAVSIDHRADLWSLGVIAFECMTGALPFQAATLMGLAFQICSGKAPLPSSKAAVPDGFDAWFARAVAKEPDQRFPSARIMAEELRGLCGQMPMLWEPEAAAPSLHFTREKTELEPVLELTRRARASALGPGYPIDESDSVAPTFGTFRPFKRARATRWIGAAALLGIALGLGVMLAAKLQPTSVGVRVATFRQQASARWRGTAANIPPSAASAARSEPVPVADAGAALPDQLTVPRSAGRKARDFR